MRFVWMALKGVLIALLILAVLNLWPDEQLDPDLARWRANRSAPVASAENLYYGMFGLRAPIGEDPFAAGRERVERYVTFGYTPDAQFDGGLVMDQRLLDLCDAGQPNCSLSMAESVTLLPELEAAHRELLTRYLMLHQVTDRSYPMDYALSSPIPSFRDLFQLQRLVMLRIIERAASGDDAAAAWAWDTLEDQLAVHRHWLANASFLIEKMVMTHMVEVDISTYAMMMSDAAARGEGLPPRLPPRLTAAERSLIAAFRNEAMLSEFNDEGAFRDALMTMETSAPLRWLVYNLAPFNYNATVNYMTAHARKSAELSVLSASEFHARVDEMQFEAPGTWDMLVNTLGAITMSIAVPDNGRVIYRLHDLDAELLLLRIAARALDQGVIEADMAAFLAELGPGMRSPYDDSPAVYAGGKLFFVVARDGSLEPPTIPFTPRG